MAVQHFSLLNYDQQRIALTRRYTYGHTIEVHWKLKKTYKRGQVDKQKESHLKLSCGPSWTLLSLKLSTPTPLQVRNNSKFCLCALAQQKTKLLGILFLILWSCILTSDLFLPDILHLEKFLTHRLLRLSGFHNILEVNTLNQVRNCYTIFFF